MMHPEECMFLTKAGFFSLVGAGFLCLAPDFWGRRWRRILNLSRLEKCFVNVKTFDSMITAAAVTREFGSTSSIDVQSTGGESFFRMLQDYKAVDERSPAPPQFKQLIQGRVNSVHDGRSNTAPLPRAQQTPQAPPKQRSTTIERSQTIHSPKQPRRYPSKREKRDRRKTGKK